jgi:hypothetical protein
MLNKYRYINNRIYIFHNKYISLTNANNIFIKCNLNIFGT